ncbi:hypothetical protein [Tahibacter amnicola]|uniref:Secreted protein n=1 Tax=Tahibacter amnicola TaxID=2976241 RepID=A0ABY6BBG9_9GAMM|nr:hypothetical protein [Tahibacter amnicola]UXI67403.1 hypothetical protein N4264_22125 [Tahibacter amnicola]
MSTFRSSRTRRLLAVSALTLAAAGAFPSSVFAQATGNVDVDINLQGGVTILYYYSAVDVNINLTDVVGSLAGCSGSGDVSCSQGPAAAAVTAVPTPAVSPTELVANFNISPPALGFNAASLPLVLQNVWAVRAVGGGANTTVAVAGGAGTTLAGPTAGTSIGLSGFQVQSGAAGPASSIQFPDPGLVNARSGDVRMSLNLTSATQLGMYSTTAGSNTDVNFTLTVTNT